MSLDRLLGAQSLAIVGASPEPAKISGMMLEFLRKSGFAGRVYPVNPRYPAIGEWTCHASVAALPEIVDLVAIVVPVAHAFEAIEQAVARGVPFIVLLTGGFGEGATGDAGRERLARLRAILARGTTRLVGPNCVGMVNFRRRMPVTFADWYGRDTGQRGGVAILTHSGSVGGLVFSSLQLAGVGVDHWIATGNEADLTVADFIEHFAADAAVGTIVCFIEGVSDGRRFIAAARRAIEAGRRIVVLKAGASEASVRATISHTTKRSSAPDVYRGVFDQLGIIQVQSLAELAYAVKLVTSIGARSQGRVGILSASGGACSLFADHVVDAGLEMPLLDAATQAALAQHIPEYGGTENPVDLSADVVSRRAIVDGALAVLEREAQVDTWLVFGRPIIDRYHAEIRAFAARSEKAIVVTSGVPVGAEAERALAEAGIPLLLDPALCLRALGRIVQRRRSRGWTRASVAFETDADFGPIVAITPDHAPAGRDRGRIVRALPLTEAEIRAAACDATDDPRLQRMLEHAIAAR